MSCNFLRNWFIMSSALLVCSANLRRASAVFSFSSANCSMSRFNFSSYSARRRSSLACHMASKSSVLAAGAGPPPRPLRSQAGAVRHLGSVDPFAALIVSRAHSVKAAAFSPPGTPFNARVNFVSSRLTAPKHCATALSSSPPVFSFFSPLPACIAFRISDTCHGGAGFHDNCFFGPFATSTQSRAHPANAAMDFKPWQSFKPFCNFDSSSETASRQATNCSSAAFDFGDKSTLTGSSWGCGKLLISFKISPNSRPLPESAVAILR
mmetsp:Transcript_133111/g.385075  ORF Transcript_133111/g.385075 Transcript_133111/m.385075 type:complete len:266 (-) Transcript_133111:1250-2047(-)